MRESRRSTGNSAKGYQHRIPSRRDILDVMHGHRKPVTLVDLKNSFKLKSKQDERSLRARLKLMVRDGQLQLNQTKEYSLSKHVGLVIGTIKAHRDGFGFLVAEDGSDDIYISTREMAALWDGDRVAVRVRETTRGKQGHVVDILERGTKTFVGLLKRERGSDFVVTSDVNSANILIPRGHNGGAKSGDIVQVKLLEQPTHRNKAIGTVLRVAGRFDDPGMPSTMAILSFGLPCEWSNEIKDEIKDFPKIVPSRSKKGREDLRDLPLVTIDGSDARDYDDAVYCEKDGLGWRLIVAIADVSHYVKPNSRLDKEARTRGTSIYFPDQVIPMLPEVLSNGLCSLNPGVDRLCLCCEINISNGGEVTRSRFFKGVMNSAARFTYKEAAQIIDGKRLKGEKDTFSSYILLLHEVYLALAGKRRKRGAISFELPESDIILNESGLVVEVNSVKRFISHKVIEECMIAANVEAAKYLQKAKIPALYRIHAEPDSDRLEELVLFLHSLGHKLSSPNRLKPHDLNSIIQNAKDYEVDVIESAILKAMSRAVYQSKNIGHFGLALPIYTHFTSPIRRYPDLLVHRAIKHLIVHGDAKRFHYKFSEIENLGEHCSRTERRADEAVWEVEERLKCEFLKERIGEQFEVVITSIMPFGFFARIPSLAIDGLVHKDALPLDYYRRQEGGLSLIGENTNRSYRLNDRLKVKLTNVVVEEGKIDFMLAH
ncbi:MAG: ribonuclease R [Rhodospirillaceae bacterium]|nr:ribonuclease R [Rhodospirillaceae bacterium]